MSDPTVREAIEKAMECLAACSNLLRRDGNVNTADAADRNYRALRQALQQSEGGEGLEKATEQMAPVGPTLYEDIRNAINRHSAENGSNTPDWILAHYLMKCLEVWDWAVTTREGYYGRGADIPGLLGGFGLSAADHEGLNEPSITEPNVAKGPASVEPDLLREKHTTISLKKDPEKESPTKEVKE